MASSLSVSSLVVQKPGQHSHRSDNSRGDRKSVFKIRRYVSGRLGGRLFIAARRAESRPRVAM